MSNREEILDQEELEIADNVETVEEETLAAKSIAPKGKAASMNAVMDLMSKMSGDDINKFVATMTQFGPNKDYGVGDNSEQMRASVAMKPSAASGMSEDLQAIFNGEELSEEFVEKTTILFEAALNARIIVETTRLEEEYAVKLEEQVAEISEELTNKLDSYLTYTVENWMKENEVAIESTLRNELMEEFIEGLRNLFAEHYISVPQEQVNVLESLADKVNQLQAKLDESIDNNNELRGLLVVEAANKIFSELASDLVVSQQEKFAALAEGIEFDGDLEIDAKKLSIIKENYFGGESQYSSNIEEETFEGQIAESVNLDPQVNRYVQAIARTIKK
jgi:signal transduction histidine kinase